MPNGSRLVVSRPVESVETVETASLVLLVRPVRLSVPSMLAHARVCTRQPLGAALPLPSMSPAYVDRGAEMT
jgi:hypothetical protein